LLTLAVANSTVAESAERLAMNTVPIEHVVYSTNISFEEFTANFTKLCGTHHVEAYESLLSDPAQSASAVKAIGAMQGSSGFMIFATYDHGALLSVKGAPRKAKQYEVGNPLIAARMTEHDIRAALYAPLRVLVYEDTNSKTIVEYDLPSTLFGQFHNAKVDVVAKELNEKLSQLIKRASQK
jgi:uncharacterized protein (DUF302 family)